MAAKKSPFESKTLGAQDALARARLLSVSLRSPSERRALAESRMKGVSTGSSTAPYLTGPGKRQSGVQLSDRMKQEDKLSDESGLKRRRKGGGY